MPSISSPVGATIHEFANEPTMVRATGDEKLDSQARIRAANSARHGKHPLGSFRRYEIWQMLTAAGVAPLRLMGEPEDHPQNVEHTKWANMTKDDLLLHTQTMDMNQILPEAQKETAPDSPDLSAVMARLDKLEAENAALKASAQPVKPPAPAAPMVIPPDLDSLSRPEAMKVCAATKVKFKSTDSREDIIERLKNAANSDPS